MKKCVNHPDRQALSICHGCGKDFCESCLAEGSEYYYCMDTKCQELLKKETFSEELPGNITCPKCKSELELSDEERISGQVYCPECDALIDIKVNPYKMENSGNYIELFSSLNQGDIGLIKSLMDDSDIDYYVLGENFLGVRPLVEPARFFVNEEHLEEAKAALKDFDLNIFGVSANQYKK